MEGGKGKTGARPQAEPDNKMGWGQGRRPSCETSV